MVPNGVSQSGADVGSDLDLDGLVAGQLQELLERYSPDQVPSAVFFGARYDLGLAWTHYPRGAGGLGGTPLHHRVVERTLRGIGSPDPFPGNPMRTGMVAPTIAFHGTELQRNEISDRSTPGRWSGVSCSVSRGLDQISRGWPHGRKGWKWVAHRRPKVWTSLAHVAQWGLLLARTDPTVPKHRGLTCFLVDLKTNGVEVRPLKGRSRGKRVR